MIGAIETAIRDAVRAELAPVLQELRELIAGARQQAANDAPEVLNLEQAAAFVGASVSMLRGQIKSGNLKGKKPAGSRDYRIFRRDLIAWLEGHHHGPKSVPHDVDLDVEASRILRLHSRK